MKIKDLPYFIMSDKWSQENGNLDNGSGKNLKDRLNKTEVK
jgi:hypothetical protein